MGMTKEQLIREMIQIELLYQTRRKLKLLKENEKEDEEENQPQSQGEEPVPETEQEKKKEVEEKSTNKKTLIGDNSENKYIKDVLKNTKIQLSKEYKNESSDEAKTLTQIKYSELAPDDFKKIWGEYGYFFNLLTKSFKIPRPSAIIICDILSSTDKGITDPNAHIFSVFDKIFPLRSVEYNLDLKDIITNLQSKDKSDVYQKIYAAKENEGAYSSGKGEFLSVLLFNNCTSGGTAELDLVFPNNKWCEIKQITTSQNILTFTLSVKSDLRSSKNKFIEAYKKLGDRAFSLIEEFKKLNVDEDVIEKINKYQGYVSTAFNPKSLHTTEYLNKKAEFEKENPTENGATKEIEISDEGFAVAPRSATEEKFPDPAYINFSDISDAFEQALLGLKARTYNHIISFKNSIDEFKKDSNNPKFTTQLDDIFSENLPDDDEDKNAALQTLKTNLLNVNQAINIDSEKLDILNAYNLKIKTFNELKKKDEYGFKKLMREDHIKWNEVSLSKENEVTFFKKLDISVYNARVKELLPDYSQFFLLNENIPIFIDFMTSKSKIAANDVKNISSYIDNAPGFLKNNINKIFLKNNKVPSFQTIYKDYVIPIIENTFNNQIVLTEEQLKKINVILNKIQNENTDDYSKINKITKLGQKNEYLVVEPLNLKDLEENNGEFVIDISFYKNNRKRHVDTLHSQDLKVQTTKSNNKGAFISKKQKDSTIDVTGDSKQIIPQVNVELDDVISDKELINEKLKQFNLFNSLQPETLEQVFFNNNSSGSNNKRNISSHDLIDVIFKDEEITIPNSLNSTSESQQKQNDTTATSKKYITQLNKENEFIKNLRKIKDKTGENNLMSELCDLYEAVDEIEVKIKDYYVKKHNVLIFKETSSNRYSDAYRWANVIQDSHEGFVTAVLDNAITCNADNVHPKKTVKSALKELIRRILQLMLDVQKNALKY